MIGKKDATNVKINSMLGKGSDFQGDFTAEGSARVDGNVNGNVKVTGTLIVGSTGRISGNVDAQASVIGGEVLGNVMSPEKTELTGTARVLGDVTTSIIVIDEHAVFQGRCDMSQNAPDRKTGLTFPVKSPKTGKKSAKAAIQEALQEAEEAGQVSTGDTSAPASREAVSADAHNTEGIKEDGPAADSAQAPDQPSGDTQVQEEAKQEA